MKIEKPNHSTIPFHTLEAGECFYLIYGHDVYMRMSNPHGHLFDAVNLGTGNQTIMNSDTPVILIEAKVVVE